MRNRNFQVIVAGAMILQLAWPMAVAAMNGTGTGEGSEPRGQLQANMAARICDAFDQQAERIMNQSGQRQTRLETGRGNRHGVMTQQRDRQETRLGEIRDNFDERHQVRIGLLLDKVGDDQAKQAVLEFQQALKDALSVRRSAYDAAQGDYRSAVDAVVAERQEKIDGLVGKLQSAIDAAVAEAKAACDSEDVDLKALRDKLRTDLKTLRDNFRVEMQAISPVGDSIRPLVDARRAAFDAARAAFQASVDTAKETLRNQLAELAADDAVDAETEVDDSE
ncbi:MAG: hypothetical protein V1738_02510 [Patescibacteria group bacterium]